jgi:hypothetical protein
MRHILDRLLSFGEFEVVLFGDQVILEEPIEHWPLCDVLIGFFSRGFPLAKAVEYVRLRQPFCVNDLSLQYVLLDRRLVLQLLEAIDVPTLGRLVVNRDTPQLPAELVELVSRDFNVDLSSPSLFPQHTVRMLDEDTLQVGRRILRKPFVEKPADAEDHNIFVYYPRSMGGGVRRLFRKVANKSSEFIPDVIAVREGASFIYEEFREADNAEDVKIYTVGLHYAHAETRKSPVVDGVVRRNSEGKELREVAEMTCEEQEIARRVCMAFGQTICGFDILRTGGRSLVVDVNGWSFVKGNEGYLEKCAAILRDTFNRATVSKRNSLGWRYEPFPSATEGQWRLKCCASVFRHGDRMPKQKLKLTVRHAAFFELLPEDYAGEDVIIRDRQLLIKAFGISERVLKESDTDDEDGPKLKQLVEVLGKKMRVPGTKLQLRKIVKGAAPSMLLIVKWGGEYTHAGRHHSKDLGENMRKELTILNRSLLDDVKIYCSVERRVLATADVFAKAFLGSAEVAPDVITVLKEALDDSFVSKDDIYAVKRRIGERLMDPDKRIEEEDKDLAPELLLIKLKECLTLHRKVMRDRSNLETVDLEGLQPRWCCSDSPALFRERWERHFADVLDGPTDWFDPSKISDLYDSLKFDALHHRNVLEALFVDPDDEASRQSLHDLYLTAQQLFDYVAPREYGMTGEERQRIGLQISGLLLHRVVGDLNASISAPAPYARLYFTKESHMTALYNILRTSGLALADEPSGEMDYLSHICFELYERMSSAGVRYSLRIGLSNGAHSPRLLDSQLDGRHALAVTAKRWLTDYVEGGTALKVLNEVATGCEESYHSKRAVRKSSEPMLYE